MACIGEGKPGPLLKMLRFLDGTGVVTLQHHLIDIKRRIQREWVPNGIV